MDYSYSTSTSPASEFTPMFIIMSVFWLIIGIFYLVVWWKLFVKMNEPGWKCLIPIYNIYVWYEKILGNGLWMFSIFAVIIPFIGWIVPVFLSVVMVIRTAKAFGRGAGTAVGLFLANGIFYPILAFGSAEFTQLPAWDIHDPFDKNMGEISNTNTTSYNQESYNSDSYGTSGKAKEYDNEF